MASSRWKRFAFFDRQTLNIPTHVLFDIFPNADANNSRQRVSLSNIDEDQSLPESAMVVTTASLPLDESKQFDHQKSDQSNEDDATALARSAMWSSLTACTSPTDWKEDDDTVLLASQKQQIQERSHSRSSKVLDGLVLVFLSSRESDYVHCVDITMRCNPPTQDDEMDGWRGYWTPFCTDPSRNSSSTRAEDRIISDHMEAVTENVVGLSACRDRQNLLVACISSKNVIVYENPHLDLSCRLPLTMKQQTNRNSVFKLASPWNEAAQGAARCVDIEPGFVAVGSESGSVLVYIIQKGFLRLFMTIPSPTSGSAVTSVKLTFSSNKVFLYVTYHRPMASSPRGGLGGVCCFDLGSSKGSHNSPTARHDLDSRHVSHERYCDVVGTSSYMVARNDGLYTYSYTQKISVSPIDGAKLAICNVPSPLVSAKDSVGASYALVASTDTKSGRDAVDVYDSTNKLVAFHALLSPGHKALQVAGVTTPSNRLSDGSFKAGRSSAVVFTSEGSIVTLTEKITSEKVSLLVQKNLYSAAISMAYADPTYQPSDITALYRRHAEHLYRKGDFAAAMDQYIFTIGSLESSHVIFRYLDAPKIPFLAKYLEELRSRNLATPVHNELLRTCYLKLNDTEAAEKILASTSKNPDSSSASIIGSLTHKPKEALATICTFEAPQAAEALVAHGAVLARALPRETAGVVVSLCLGTYSPTALAEAASKASNEASKMLQYAVSEETKQCTPFPVHLFASAFMENPKMLRLILAHCNRNKCHLTPILRRTLLELTLAEWNVAKRNGDTEAEKLRRKEAITALTDAHCHDLGDYDALVIVQSAGFSEGELLLYERLQMIPMLLSRYAMNGGDRARRQMLAMCRNDPDLLAEVLVHFVSIASERVNHDRGEDESLGSEEAEILDDIREALNLARNQGVLSPVRIARILAGEGVGQVRHDDGEHQRTVPLSVALDYVGDILDQSRAEIAKLRSEVESYNKLCNSMEADVEALLSGKPKKNDGSSKHVDLKSIDIEEIYSRLKVAMVDGPKIESRTAQHRESFWRDMNQSEDRFDTITKYFAKGIIQ